MTPTADAIAQIKAIAKGAGLVVTIKQKPAGRRGNHEGSFIQRKNGLWVARLTWDRRVYTVSSMDRVECGRKLRALQRQLDEPAKAPLPPTETGPDGREFVRLGSPTFRRWIYERDKGLCGICGKPVGFAEMHVDHIRPRVEGGTDHITNFRVSHPACNQTRRVERSQPIYVG